VRRHDYLPFGEENVYNAAGGSRTAANGHMADGVRQKFVGYERDTETGLDFVQARYYANVQGRFTSPDMHWLCSTKAILRLGTCMPTQRGIRSIEKQIAEHKSKIAGPAK
jgi:RHS repeat-associated protein